MSDCQECGTPMPTATRRATYCGAACRARAHRKRSNAAAMAGSIPPAQPRATETPSPGVEAALLAELTASNLVATTPGQQALALARRIDHGIQDSGAGIAAMSRQLEALRARMSLASDKGEEDLLDRARRRRHEAALHEGGGGQVRLFTGPAGR